MTECSPFTETKADPWKRIAEHHLRGKKYMTAKRLASKMKLGVSLAGSILVALGWKKISNRVYERGDSH